MDNRLRPCLLLSALLGRQPSLPWPILPSGGCLADNFVEIPHALALDGCS